jgi:hypothetical protein
MPIAPRPMRPQPSWRQPDNVCFSLLGRHEGTPCRRRECRAATPRFACQSPCSRPRVAASLRSTTTSSRRAWKWIRRISFRVPRRREPPSPATPRPCRGRRSTRRLTRIEFFVSQRNRITAKAALVQTAFEPRFQRAGSGSPFEFPDQGAPIASKELTRAEVGFAPWNSVRRTNPDR